MAVEEARHRGPAPSLRLSTCADDRHLSWLRRRVRDFLQQRRSPPDLIDDLELVVSELSTNVIRHTDSDVVSVRLAASGDRWVLDVADAEDLPPLDEVTLPPPGRPDGRGLFITSALMDEVSIVRIGERQFVRCVRNVH